jgi:DNA polymerase-3 subunit alpha (Gram-positive type)
MSAESFFDAVYKALPEITGCLQLDHIEYMAGKKRAVAFFTSDTLIHDRQFDIIRRQLRRAFPQIQITMRIASPRLADDFLADPAKYAGVFEPILLKHYPAMTPTIHKISWKRENDSLVLEFDDQFTFEYMSRQEVRGKLSVAIHDIFLIRPELSLRLKQDMETRMERQIANRKREHELLDEQPQQGPEPVEFHETIKKKSRKILGGNIAAEPVDIKGLSELSGKVTIAGKVVSIERRNIQKSDSVMLAFVLTDNTDSIACKLFLGQKQNGYRSEEILSLDPETEKKRIEEVILRIHPGEGLKVRGECQMDTYDNVLTLRVRDINAYELPKRKDQALSKRIELHTHTHMSYMDGLVSAEDLIARAAEYGHQAIAITDQSVVQAFPDAFSAAKKNKIKLIPGMEGTMMDDTGIVVSPSDAGLDEAFVVLDFETTGLNPGSDRIIEIGAVRLEKGQVTETFSALVNPGVPLDPKVIKITGIKDYMLKDEPKAEELLPRLMAFIGTSPLAAHNASFDMGFLRAELLRIGQDFDLPQIDTLTYAQKLYPVMKRYRLQDLCRHLGVMQKNAHRAVYDATTCAQCLALMLLETKGRGAASLREIDEKITGYNRNTRHHLTLLVKSQQGMQNINRLVSLSHMRYFYREPLLPRDQIVKYRDGLLLGSGCQNGELFEAILDRRSDAELERIAEFYDFIEVQPESNYGHLIRSGKIIDRDQLREINKALVGLGEKLGIPVVATGDVRFLDPEDAIYRTIIKNSLPLEKDGCDEQPPLYLKTTDEMLEDFAWLGEEKAREIVIGNPSKIASLVGSISLYPPHPENKTTFAPVWEDAEESVRNMAEKNAGERYGSPLPQLVRERLDKELRAINGYGYATLYSIANKLVKKSQDDGYMVGSRGSVGSSFAATMCGITEVNPLPPHYLCKPCNVVDFDVPAACQTGLDLPDKACMKCGKLFEKDGYDIPFEVFLGFEGDKVPDIDLNFCSEYQAMAHAYVEELFGHGYVFRAGTIGTLQEKTAFGLVLKYLEERSLQVSQAEKTRLAQGCIGVKRTTGQHPGGMVIVPKTYEINQFTAIQRPANDMDSQAITTHYDFRSMHDILVKVDVLGHDDPTMIKKMEELSGIHYQDIPMDDSKVRSLFRTPEALGLTKELLQWSTGTLGIPEFGTIFVRGILDDTQPETMADLIRISGLSHGTEVWAGNSRELILSKTASLSECICTREDIMVTLMDKGLGSKMAFDIMERVRKGNGLTAAMEQEMREHDVPDWFIKSCWKIAYMFPKGHAVAYVTMAIRVGWFKINRPLVYYAAYFSIRGKEFNALTMCKPVSFIRESIDTLRKIGQRDMSDKNEKELVILELVHEMNLRGFRFLTVDLYKSDANQFLIEGNSLRCPFTALNGFGESAAQGILNVRSEPFISIEDLKIRAKISSPAIELLRESGALNGLTDSNQVDFFSLI